MVGAGRSRPGRRRLVLAGLRGLMVLGLLYAAVASAQYPFQPWQFRPMEPHNARGVPPQPAPTQILPQAPGQAPAQFAVQPSGQLPGQPSAPWPPQLPRGQYMPPYPGPAAGPYSGVPMPYAPQSVQPYGTRPAARSSAPRLEVDLSDDRPYVQENVLLRLRVVSDGNLATASPDLAAIDEVLFEKLDGPTVRTRGSGNEREIVNEFVMIMTPLRDGTLEVGPLKVSGTLAGGASYEAVSDQPLQLRVRPAVAAVRPWLPLQGLRIRADVTDSGIVEEGRPVTLSVELEAEGGTGSQLPSLEPMLRSDEFRVYREQTVTDTRLSSDGRTLLGKRIEYYTLVPHSRGRIHLPELRLGWWNVVSATAEASSVPVRSLAVGGDSTGFGFGRSPVRSEGASWALFWLPLAAILLLLIGYWGGVWWRGRSLGGQPDGVRGAGSAGGQSGSRVGLRQRLARGLSALGAWMTGWLRRLNPQPLLGWLRRTGARLVPGSMRVYQCAKAANACDDPAAWCLAFQAQACRHLRARGREPLPRIADRIISLRPGADQARVSQLMQQLDFALYNRGDIDFARWKQEFRRALRPGTGAIVSLVASRVRPARLPALNPRSAES